MELVALYNRIHRHERIPLITVESVIHRLREKYMRQPRTEVTLHALVDELTEEMRTRRLDKYYQIEIVECANNVDILVHKINPLQKPKEIVIWN